MNGLRISSASCRGMLGMGTSMRLTPYHSARSEWAASERPSVVERPRERATASGFGAASGTNPVSLYTNRRWLVFGGSGEGRRRGRETGRG